jgi:hypothetical protein
MLARARVPSGFLLSAVLLALSCGVTDDSDGSFER